MKSKRIFTIVACVLLSAVMLGAIAATGSELPKDAVVTATASAKISINPDVAYVKLGVTTTDADSSKAADANAAKMESITAALVKIGVAKEDISTSNLSMYPRYDYSDSGEGKIKGYEVPNSITIKTLDVDKAGEIVNVAMKSGANTLNGVTYDATKTEEVYQQALAQAVKKAREKAEVMAVASGKALGDIIDLTEGSESYNPYNSNVYARNNVMEAAASDAGIGDTLKPGNIEISAQATATYAMN